MKKKYFERVPMTDTWKCLKCGKIVKDMGWAGHLGKCKEKTQEVNKHIDTY